MSDPQWAPQNQPQSAWGVSATNVGRDQNTYNTYTSLSHDGMTLSYKAFRHAIDVEVDKVTREAEQELFQVDQKYRSLLTTALSDYKDVSSQRDLALEQLRQARRIGTIGDWVTWRRLAAAALILLVAGLFSGYRFSDSVQGGSPSTAAQTPTGGPKPLPTATVTATVTVAAPAVPTLAVTDDPVQCGGTRFIVRLESIPPGIERNISLAILAAEYQSRLRNVKLNAVIHETLTNGTCAQADRDRLMDYGFLWAGPYAAKSTAVATCEAFKRKAISEDCQVTTG